MLKKLFLVLIPFFGLSVLSYAAATTYCTPISTNGTSEGDYVARVLLTGSNGTLDSITAGDAPAPSYYIYYSGATAPTLLTGQTYTVTVQVGTYWQNNSIAAWIDFNGDGTFSSWEKVGETDLVGPNTVASYTFTVPATGTTSVTRLRVRDQYIAVGIDPCAESGNYGETEDYDLNGHLPLPLAGGEGYRKIPVDSCPNGDISPTPYDGLCAGMSAAKGILAGTQSSLTVNTITMTTGSVVASGSLYTGMFTTGDIVEHMKNDASGSTMMMYNDPHVCPDKDMEDAYMFGHMHGLVRANSCQSARTSDKLLRIEAAEILSLYALHVMHKTADTTRSCEFADMRNLSKTAQQYAIMACQLGLMGLKGDGTPASTFSPTSSLDKAQFSTILSRMLYGITNNSSDTCWYCKHVDALKEAGVITVTTDLTSPLLRGWAMLMLMRLEN